MNSDQEWHISVWQKVLPGKHALRLPACPEHKLTEVKRMQLPHCLSLKSNSLNKPRSPIFKISICIKYLQDSSSSFTYFCEYRHMHTCAHTVISTKQNRNPIYMYIPTSPTFGCKSKCSQACIKLSTIPSPNKPASTVSVTTKETLDKKKSTIKYTV